MTFIAIPFYKREDLVPRVLESLSQISEELRQLGIEIVLINDSPGHGPLDEAIQQALGSYPNLKFRLIENQVNVGFAKSCNKAFQMAVDEKRSVLLLNSDCVVTPGSIREVVNVAGLDEKIAFVCPRSNNAGIASLPQKNQHREISVEEALFDFGKISPFLPRFSYSPIAVGFCFFVKWQILSDFGFFDEIYDKGYQEENDLVIRANRAGYRAAFANHSFVWHEGTQSFVEAESTPEKRDLKNLREIEKRYPFYLELVSRFQRSPERRAEELLVATKVESKPLLVFDFTHIGSYFNGTFEAAIRIAEKLIENHQSEFQFGILISSTSWSFHGLDHLKGAHRLDPRDDSMRAAVMVRVGQPFSAEQLSLMFSQAAIPVIYMLDTIAMDCGENSLEFDISIWDKAMRLSSAVISISDFTSEQLKNRFAIGPDTVLTTSRLSMDTHDYKIVEDEIAEKKGDFLFVVGNKFPHKFVNETCEILLRETEHEIKALGYSGTHENFRLEAIESGSISEKDLDEIWRNARVVVFPSHYEGFGLPVLHALARKKPVFVRNSALNRELKTNLPDGINIHFFESNSELAQTLSGNLPTWVQSKNATLTNHDWASCASDLAQVVNERIASINYDQVLARTKSSRYDLEPLSAFGYYTPAARVGRAIENVIEKVLKVQIIKKAAFAFYKLMRPQIKK